MTLLRLFKCLEFQSQNKKIWEQKVLRSFALRSSDFIYVFDDVI